MHAVEPLLGLLLADELLLNPTGDQSRVGTRLKGRPVLVYVVRREQLAKPTVESRDDSVLS